MQRYTDVHTYTHMKILSEVLTQTAIFLHGISGSMCGLNSWKKYYTVIDLYI